MAHASWYERSEYRGSGQACMTPILFRCLSPAKFYRSTLVTAHSWWIQSSLDLTIRCWSRILSPMGRIGSRYSAINFSTPLKRIRWAASSGYLTRNSFPQSFEDSGADIACWGESRPLIESLARSPNHIANPPVSSENSGKELLPGRRAIELDFA